MFEVAFLAMEVLAQVPVGGVEQTQGELRGGEEKEGSLPVNSGEGGVHTIDDNQVASLKYPAG